MAEAPHHIQGLRPAGVTPKHFFPAFPALPAEIRCQIWQQAVLADHAARVVPVAHESWRVVPTRRLLAPSAVLAACAEARAEAVRLYPLALPLLPTARPGVYYPGGRRRERVPRVEETDQSTDEDEDEYRACDEADGGRPFPVRKSRALRGLVRVSLELDIFFLGHRHADWAPQRRGPKPHDGLGRASLYATRSLRRAERARVVRVMGSRLGWPYAGWADDDDVFRDSRRSDAQADARLRQTFAAVREVYYLVTFSSQALPDVLRACRRARSPGEFCGTRSLPSYVSKRFLEPLKTGNVDAQAQGGDDMDVNE